MANWTFEKLVRDELVSRPLDEQMQIARLCLSTSPDFYGLVPWPAERVLEFIVGQLGKPGTETADIYGLSRDGEPVGIIATLPSAVVDRVKREGALAIIRQLGAGDRAVYMERLGLYSATVEPLNTESLYLSRIAVAPSAHGTGAGIEAMRRFLDLGSGRALSLHVKADNAPAVGLYRRYGFDFLSDAPFEFRAMFKSS